MAGLSTPTRHLALLLSAEQKLTHLATNGKGALCRERERERERDSSAVWLGCAAAALQ